MDIAFNDENGNPSWAEHHNWDRLGELGEAQGLIWGGRWERFPDRPHFEYHPQLSIPQAQALHQQGGIGRVWREIEE